METQVTPGQAMESKPSIAKLAQSFAKAQGVFRTPTMNRTAKIEKEGRLLYETHYADLQECIDCIRKPLAENGLSFNQVTQLRNGAWYLVLKLMHESGESIETYLPLNVQQSNQQLGGTLTYLKRYQLSAFFGLAADFDDDGNGAGNNQVTFGEKGKGKQAPKTSAPKPAAKPPTQPPNVAPISQAQQKELLDLATKKGLSTEQMKDIIALGYKKISSKDLTVSEFQEIKDQFSKMSLDDIVFEIASMKADLEQSQEIPT